MGSWFCSNFLEALSHTITKLSLLSNSFVPPPEHNYLGKVQLEHRATTGQGTANLTSAWGCWAARSVGGRLEGWRLAVPAWPPRRAQLGDLQHKLSRAVLASPGAGKAEPVLIRVGVRPTPAPDEWKLLPNYGYVRVEGPRGSEGRSL